MKEKIEKLVEKFERLKPGEQLEIKNILGQYVKGEISMEDVHSLLLDEELIPMPSRCTMYQKPKISVEAEDELKASIREKVFSE
jgi:hypothetical protein